MLIIGLLFLCLPSFITALSLKYQAINTLGDPYISVTFARVGSAILLYLLFFKFINSNIYLFLLIFLNLINFNINAYKIHNKNLDFKYEREITRDFILDNAQYLSSSKQIQLDYRRIEERNEDCIFGLYLNIKNFKCLDLHYSHNENFINRKYDNKNSLIELIFTNGDFVQRNCKIYFFFYKCTDKIGSDIKKLLSNLKLNGGFSGWEYNPKAKWHFIWSSDAESFFEIINFYNKTQNKKISFKIDKLLKKNKIQIFFNDKLINSNINSHGLIELDLKLMTGRNVLKFKFEGDTLKFGSDPRNFAYKIYNINY